jgi:rod shape-determining protein MreD
MRTREFTAAIGGVIVAFLLYTVLSRISTYLIYALNVFSIVVIHFAVKRGETSGALMGAFCGLIQDSFSVGVFGLSGISKTVMGFIAGYASRRINVVQFKKQFVFIFFLLCIELIIWSSLYSFILSERLNTAGGLLLLQPIVTALLGSLFFLFLPKLKALFIRPKDEK